MPGPTAVARARRVRTRRSRRRASLARASTGDAIVDARVSRLATRVSRVDAFSRGRWRRRWWRRRWAAPARARRVCRRRRGRESVDVRAGDAGSVSSSRARSRVGRRRRRATTVRRRGGMDGGWETRGKRAPSGRARTDRPLFPGCAHGPCVLSPEATEEVRKRNRPTARTHKIVLLRHSDSEYLKTTFPDVGEAA